MDKQTNKVRLAIAGIGNNISSLLQGIAYYENQEGQDEPQLPNAILHGIHVTALEVVLAFDIDESKISKPVYEAILLGGNNFPKISNASRFSAVVQHGLVSDSLDADSIARIAELLKTSHADVLLLSLPASMPDISRAYAEAALSAKIAIVNCSPDRVARDEDLLRRFKAGNVPILGDDLASQFGSSLIHKTLLDLLRRRGMNVDGTYQVNLGGNQDFQNLRQNGASKLESKLNVLNPAIDNNASISVIPSGGYIEYLSDRKVAHLSIEGRGWADSVFRLELRLEVQDSSNAAGVIIDLIRIAKAALLKKQGGFEQSAATLLKSPPRDQIEAE